MAREPKTSEPRFTADAGDRGATVRSLYVEREVKVFAIHEFEVEVLSQFNTLATAGFSVGAALISYSIGIWTNAAFSEKLTPMGEASSHILAPILAALGVASLLFALWALWRRKSAWTTIQNQSSAR